MRPDGVLAQWLPLHGMTASETFMLARTFLAVFPSAALCLLNHGEAALLGAPQGMLPDADRLRVRLAKPDLARDLTRLGFRGTTPDDQLAAVLALCPIHGPALRALVGDGPVVTDDRPLIEQFATGLLTDARHNLDENARELETDGRRALLTRLLAATTEVLPVRGPLPTGMARAMQAERDNLERWVRETRGPLDPFNSSGR